MSVPTCTFIRESTGQPCQGVALKGTDRCYHHQADFERREYIKHLRANGSAGHVMEVFNLPPLETVDDIQICLSNLFQAVSARRMMDGDSDRLLAILRVASRNLHIKEAATRASPSPASPAKKAKKPKPDIPDATGWSREQFMAYHLAAVETERAQHADDDGLDVADDSASPASSAAERG